MPSDWDIFRTILLRIESKDYFDGFYEGFESDREGDYPIIWDHIRQLLEGGYLTPPVNGSAMDASGRYFPHVLKLSFQGTDLLGSIRNEEAWQMTKAQLEKLGGGTLEIVKQLAEKNLSMIAQRDL